MEKNTKQQVPITHLVILCHGLGGSSTDWDSMMKVWKPYFAKEDPAILLVRPKKSHFNNFALTLYFNICSRNYGRFTF